MCQIFLKNISDPNFKIHLNSNKIIGCDSGKMFCERLRRIICGWVFCKCTENIQNLHILRGLGRNFERNVCKMCNVATVKSAYTVLPNIFKCFL